MSRSKVMAAIGVTALLLALVLVHVGVVLGGLFVVASLHPLQAWLLVIFCFGPAYLWVLYGSYEVLRRATGAPAVPKQA